MSQQKQSVREIFVAALSRKINKAPPDEIRAFILKAGQDNGYAPTERDDASGYKVKFSTGETISFDGADYQLI